MAEEIITPLIRPVRSPHKVTSGFGSRLDPITGKTGQHHPGIDYVNAGHVNCEVVAVADGIVWYDFDNYDEKQRWNFQSPSSGGNMVILQHVIHGKKIFSRYLHLVKNFVSHGEAVKQGHVLGIYGNIGASAGAHCHFDMQDGNGTPIDPTPIMLAGLKKSGLA